MHIPSRVEVLSWNENQVADLLREHKLHDCVDCVFQRHIDGQKLLYLKEGDVLYFLEIHDSRSRGKFWNIVKQITEKKENKGVHNLMSKFQEAPQWNNNTAEEPDDSCDDSDSSFESDYDEPDPDPPAAEGRSKPAISLERKETIKNNLLRSLMSQAAAPEVTQVDNEEEYPSDDIYDVPEDGCGEPEEDEDLYDAPSDESGGGVVGRRPPLERKESDQYLDPNDGKHFEMADEEDYEEVNAAPPPPMGRSEIDTQEEYVVPDMKLPSKPPIIVPPRPPKSSSAKKPLPAHAAENGHKAPHSHKVIQEQENYEPPQPQRGLKKPKPPPSVPSVPVLPKPPPKGPGKASPKPLRFPKKIEKKQPAIPVGPDPEELYEPPVEPPPHPKKPAVRPPIIEQENYEAPDTPERLPPKKPAVRPPIIEQENYEAPETPERLPPKKPAVRPPIIEQENYEAPDTPERPTTKPAPGKKPPHSKKPAHGKKPPQFIPEPENYEPPELQRKSKPVPIMDPEENYEDPNQMSVGMEESDGDECEEEYEIPDRQDFPPKEAAPEPPKKSHFSTKGLFHRNSSKKPPSPPTKGDKKKTIKNEVATPPKPIPPVPDSRPPPSTTPPNPPGKGIFNKFRGDRSTDKRSSMALPSLPTDNVDSKSPASGFPSLPPKPSSAPKDKPVPVHRNKPELPPSKPPQKTKRELLEEQPWFHGSISKKDVVDILKNAKRDGAYLVRNSSRDPDKCIMSISYKNDIRHLNIPCDEKGHYRLGDSGVERFKNIEELVTYFNKHDVEFSAGGKTPLTHACMKSS